MKKPSRKVKSSKQFKNEKSSSILDTFIKLLILAMVIVTIIEITPLLNTLMNNNNNNNNNNTQLRQEGKVSLPANDISSSKAHTHHDKHIAEKTKKKEPNKMKTINTLPPLDTPFQSSSIDTSIEFNKPHHYTISKPSLKVAFAITITKDGSFQDGAAVLAYSIYHTNMSKIHDISLVAFVHPDVTTSRNILGRIGYHVIEVPTPINTTAIKYTWMREKIAKNGCCGADELIKLNSYRLTQYDIVVHMDADTFIYQNFDELFYLKKSLVYTTDPNMASFKKPECMPAQGGFLIIKPNLEDYHQIINTIMTTEFVIYHGWNKSNIGWFWGGMTVQGILPYYYNKVTSSYRSIKVDRCIYNTMADTTDCMSKALYDIKTAHFTICQKPWTCNGRNINPLCKQLHEYWFQLRREAELFYSIPIIEKPCRRSYQQMTLDKALLPTLDKLQSMNRQNIGQSMNRLGQFIPDKSPDRLLPIGNSGYTQSYG